MAEKKQKKNTHTLDILGSELKKGIGKSNKQIFGKHLFPDHLKPFQVTIIELCFVPSVDKFSILLTKLLLVPRGGDKKKCTHEDSKSNLKGMFFLVLCDDTETK